MSFSRFTMQEKILEALKKVKDLELGINVVDLGLIYKIAEKDGKVNIAMTMTTPFCPYLPAMVAETKRVIEAFPGVKEATVNVVWSPPWKPERMSEAAKAELGIL